MASMKLTSLQASSHKNGNNNNIKPVFKCPIPDCTCITNDVDATIAESSSIIQSTIYWNYAPTKFEPEKYSKVSYIEFNEDSNWYPDFSSKGPWQRLSYLSMDCRDEQLNKSFMPCRGIQQCLLMLHSTIYHKILMTQSQVSISISVISCGYTNCSVVVIREVLCRGLHNQETLQLDNIRYKNQPISLKREFQFIQTTEILHCSAVTRLGWI